MKIFICLHHFLPDFVAGTEVYAYTLSKELIQNGIEVVVVIPNLGSDKTEEYFYDGIKVIKYAENSLEDREMILGRKSPEGLLQFSEILKSEKPDIIHFHELAPGRGFNIFHVEASHGLNVPIVLTFHLAEYTCMRGSLVYKDEIKCNGIINIRDCTICMYQARNVSGIKAKIIAKSAIQLFKLNVDASKWDSAIGTALGFPFVINKKKNDIIRLAGYANKIVVLSEWYKTMLVINGVDSDKLLYVKQGVTNKRPADLTISDLQLPLKVVFIGRISELKGVHLLIDAVAQLPEERVSLYIYGPETNDAYIMKCKELAGGRKNIFWMGMIDSKKVITILSKYHIFCLPSTFSEMSPLVIQEAFAAGLPVLASDVYGNAEQIKDGINGWLFRFKDSNDLADKLKYLSDDLKIIEIAKYNVPIANSFSNVSKMYLDLYLEILSIKK